MVKVLFVCHGNICRSPMAEYIFRDLVWRAGLQEKYAAQSAATSTEELGNPVYPPAHRELERHGISCKGKTARQVRRQDYAEYDHLIYMEQYNHPRLMRIIGEDPEGKCRRLLDFTEQPGDIDDPWYTGDFATAYGQIEAGCRGLLAYLEEE